MHTKFKLKSFFDSKREPSEYIEKYEENLIFFNDLLNNGSKEDIIFVIPIKTHNYAEQLKNLGYFQKSLSVLFEIERDLDLLKGLWDLYNSYNELVTLLKGICLARLKQYRKSNLEFKKLLLQNPTNDNYQDWYKSNKKDIIERAIFPITVIGVACYLILILLEFSKVEIENKYIKTSFIFIAMIGFVTIYIWKKIIDNSKIKIKG